MKLQKILSAVSAVSGLTKKYILSDSKKNDAVYARSAFMIIADKLKKYKQIEIETFVNRKHGALRTAYQKQGHSQIAEIIKKAKDLLKSKKRSQIINNTSVTEIIFLSNKTEIVMLTIKKYNNRVTIYDTANDYAKIIDKRVRKEIINFYRNSGRYTEMPYSKLKVKKKKLRLPAVQTKLFNQLELNF